MRSVGVRAASVFLGLAVLLGSSFASAFAQPPASPPAGSAPPAVSPPPAASGTAAPVAPRFGGELRIRGEALDNALDMFDQADDAYSFTRMRYRLWAEAKPREELKLYFRLGGEYRWGQQTAASIRDPESRLSLDNGWMEIAWPAKSGLTWKLGRQDLMYGEGFLIYDGTPADGSSSSYFDALKLRWQKMPWTVDLFSAKVADRGFASPARDEDLHGLYAVRAVDAATAVEGYLLHRFKHQPTVFQSGKPWAIQSPRQETTAIGARASHLPASGFQVAMEGAVQFGTYRDVDESSVPADDDRRALGGYVRAGWIAEAPMHPAAELGGLYLSGDDRGDGTYQGWDPFYSEWPKWSELLIYTLYDGTTRHFAETTDVGAWTNLLASWAELRATPWKGAGASVRTTGLRTARGEGAASVRGVLLAARVDQTLPAGPTLQLLGEHFWPGKFYDRQVTELKVAKDPAWYARLQITAGF